MALQLGELQKWGGREPSSFLGIANGAGGRGKVISRGMGRRGWERLGDEILCRTEELDFWERFTAGLEGRELWERSGCAAMRRLCGGPAKCICWDFLLGWWGTCPLSSVQYLQTLRSVALLDSWSRRLRKEGNAELDVQLHPGGDVHGRAEG